MKTSRDHITMWWCFLFAVQIDFCRKANERWEDSQRIQYWRRFRSTSCAGSSRRLLTCVSVLRPKKHGLQLCLPFGGKLVLPSSVWIRNHKETSSTSPCYQIIPEDCTTCRCSIPVCDAHDFLLTFQTSVLLSSFMWLFSPSKYPWHVRLGKWEFW